MFGLGLLNISRTNQVWRTLGSKGDIMDSSVVPLVLVCRSDSLSALCSAGHHL